MRHVSRSTAIGGAALALTLAASGCGMPGAESAEEGMEVWVLEDEVLNPSLAATMDRFNQQSEVPVDLVEFENDPYKQRLQMSMGSANAPDVFFNWGGGHLAQYVDAGQVVDMTEYLDQHPEFRDSFVPSVLEVAELDGRNYGVPMRGVQPVVLFYNADVFADAGAEPPETLGEMMELVDVFKDRGVTPITLPGAQSWTLLMWVSYLVDRIGGADVYAEISANEEDAWSHPAVVEAMEVIQEMVDRGAFGDDYQTLNYDTEDPDDSASARLAQGDAAMFLMGAWEIQGQAADHTEFVESGGLGWTSFPAVENGEGDPEALVGPPNNFFSVNNESLHGDVAVDWMRQSLASDEYVQDLVDNGAVPAVLGVEDQLAETEHAEYLTWVYELVQDAPTFTPAWDQDLDPTAAETMLTSFQLIFDGDMPPEEFPVVMGETQWD